MTIMKKALTFITGLVFLLSGIWFLLRSAIWGAFDVVYYRSVPPVTGPLLFIIGASILAIGYGIEHKKKQIIHITLTTSLIFYLFIILVSLFFESGGYLSNIALFDDMKLSINILPFKNIALYVNALFNGSMNIDIPITNLFGNLFLFLPMGIYLPYYIKKVDKMNIYSSCMVVILFIIEILQLITRRGVFDIDDIILRMFGAFIGFMFWKTQIIQDVLT